MEKSTTARGFSITEFSDQYGEKCSLQKSSLATEDCVWFGIDEPKVQALAKEMHTERADELSIPVYIHSL